MGATDGYQRHDYEKFRKSVLALPDFRGTGVRPELMSAFNRTLWADLENSGRLVLVAKTLYPPAVPQQPSDFRTPAISAAPRRGGQDLRSLPTGSGLWMSDWSGPPVSANYLAFGYAALQNGVLVLYGNLFDVRLPANNASAQPLSKRYLATTADEDGARQIAHEFAADILKLFGAQSLFGTHIYYVHQTTARSSTREIWVMDPDGNNQRQLTKFDSLTIEPAVSPDGARIAFTSYVRGNPRIFLFSVDPLRDQRFYNQDASVNAQPSFTPDGKQIVYGSSAGVAGGGERIFIANLDGSGFRPLTSGPLDAEPKINPKTGATVLFSSGRSGKEQIYMMSIDGGDIQRVTDGSGEASNPCWHPDGQSFAFAWTRGYAAGAFNIFIMQDPASGRYVQLTKDTGRKSENPTWAPDGVHIAFMSDRAGSPQIYTMLADGTEVRQLTREGRNFSPVWGK